MTFTNAQAHTLLDLMREAARTEIMPRFRKLGPGMVRTKTSAEDLVTDADEAAERRITAGLQRAFPGVLVIGEEAVAADPALLDRLDGAELAIALDPVDGTKNFAAGLPLFGVMAAVIARGEIVAGLIYDPVGDDTAIALRGEGAWMEAADGTTSDLRVAAPAPVDQMSGMISWSYLDEPVRSTVTGNFWRLGSGAALRNAAHEYRLAAAGHCHFMMYAKLAVWDHAPGWLIHREAGGYSARFDGSAYSPLHRDGGLLCAPDETSWHAVRDALFAPLR